MNEDFAYIGRAECGCVSMAIVDASDNKQTTASWIRSALKRGRIIERVPTAEVRSMAWKCEQHQ